MDFAGFLLFLVIGLMMIWVIIKEADFILFIILIWILFMTFEIHGDVEMLKDYIVPTVEHEVCNE